ncbi:MAG: aminopeptidase P family protein, partial [Chloroflexi bacterium]|nr:aminopeptidase P family protein [Chloroflexota bacterium]
MPDNLIKQKLAQASGLLRELEIPLWIVQFGRETYDHPQPVQRLAVGTTITWLAAFIVTAGGESVAIVGTGDVANVEAVGAYDLVLGYVQDIGPDLRRILHHYDPDRVALSYSVDDDSADNLTHGMYLMLRSCLEETPYGERLVSAESALGALRAR